MRASIFVSAAALLLVGVAGARAGSVTIQVIPTLAPNIGYSSNGTPWLNNAIYALENGLTQNGSDAAAYSVAPSSMPITWDVSSLDFYSWMGVAAPNVPTYGNEYGNLLFFGVHIDGGGALFRVSDLSLELTSDDPGHIFNAAYSPGAIPYAPYYVGLNYGPDGVKGTADDFYVVSGSNDALVNEFFAVGAGEALGVANNGVDTLQQQILNRAIATTSVPINFTATYTLTTGTDTTQGSATVELLPVVPLPSAVGMGALGLMGFGLVQWQRRRVRG